MRDELHISSLMLLYRPDAFDRLQSFVDAHPELEIATHAESRCVLLCETDNQRAIVDHIDALEALPGVINVSLIYHHAEPRDELDVPVRPTFPI
ncbi:chaperone NapD [Dyella sp. C9]|uniref:chaperone NapD n=1 Tax=Dyella sp. C9 TaxID=2202154 RepID=UPI000DEFC108|nr:chaperone NapD [Dyella sp. C9]